MPFPFHFNFLLIYLTCSHSSPSPYFLKTSAMLIMVLQKNCTLFEKQCIMMLVCSRLYFVV